MHVIGVGFRVLLVFLAYVVLAIVVATWAVGNFLVTLLYLLPGNPEVEAYPGEEGQT